MQSLIQDFKQSFNKGNSIVRKLIIVNVAVFAFINLIRLLAYLITHEVGNAELINKMLYMPAAPGVLMLRPWTIISYMFAHESIWHILFNMLWLYYLGGLFQEYLGNSKTLRAYLIGGLGGAAFFLLGMNLLPVMSMSAYYQAPLLGASGAVMALITGVATLLPNYEIRIFMFNIRLKFIAGFLILLSFINLIGGNPGGNLAHLGGALAGFVYIRQLNSHTLIDRIGDWLMNLKILGRKRKNEMKIHRTYTTHMRVEKPRRPNQEEIDRILDKISKSGYDSLSRNEREILFQASNSD